MKRANFVGVEKQFTRLSGISNQFKGFFLDCKFSSVPFCLGLQVVRHHWDGVVWATTACPIGLMLSPGVIADASDPSTSPHHTCRAGRNRPLYGKDQRLCAVLRHQRRDGAQVAQARRGKVHGPEQQTPITGLQGDRGRACGRLSYV